MKKMISNLLRKFRSNPIGVEQVAQTPIISCVLAGDYPTWESAKACSSGYDANQILQQVQKATRAVISNPSLFERDSVVLSEPCYSWPTTAALMWIAALNNGSLRVVDFGGALGSSYFQNRRFLETLTEVEWAIVEQTNFVEAGVEFSDSRLKFFDSIENAKSDISASTLLCSGTLQYLSDPLAKLEELASVGFEYIIFDRTPIIDQPLNRLTLQTVPTEIYEATYPSWLFSEKKFLEVLLKNYRLVEYFDSLADGQMQLADGTGIKFKGYILRRA